MAGPCEHVDEIRDDWPPVADPVCEDCAREGKENWVSLRCCLSCGHIGCCDSSPAKHATAHYNTIGHPIIRSFEPGETWRWCFSDGESV